MKLIKVILALCLISSILLKTVEHDPDNLLIYGKELADNKKNIFYHTVHFSYQAGKDRKSLTYYFTNNKNQIAENLEKLVIYPGFFILTKVGSAIDSFKKLNQLFSVDKNNKDKYVSKDKATISYECKNKGDSPIQTCTMNFNKDDKIELSENIEYNLTFKDILYQFLKQFANKDNIPPFQVIFLL